MKRAVGGPDRFAQMSPAVLLAHAAWQQGRDRLDPKQQ